MSIMRKSWSFVELVFVWFLSSFMEILQFMLATRGPLSFTAYSPIATTTSRQPAMFLLSLTYGLYVGSWLTPPTWSFGPTPLAVVYVVMYGAALLSKRAVGRLRL